MKNAKTDYKTRKEMGQLLRDAIVEYINDGAKLWLRKNQDLHMWDVTIKDAEDLICIAGLIDSTSDESYAARQLECAQRPVNTKGWTASAGKDIEQAFMAACDLDTLVRDVFPRDVWNWMSFVAQEEKDEHWAKLDDGQKYNIK
tara:strand:+ start:102 stop:533 length:432 start_codon:yes stop_codon:yes gene_type:complete